MATQSYASASLWLLVGALAACGAEDPAPGGGSAGSAPGGSAGTAAGGNATGGSGGSTSAGAGGASGGSAGGGAAPGGSSAGGQSGGTGGASGGAGGGAGGVNGGAGGGGGAGGAATSPFELTSPAFDHVEECSQANQAPCEVFPDANVMMTIGGQNMSPELTWGPGPSGTQSYAIVLHDYSNGFTHWAIWNIPATTTMLPANLSRQSMPATPAGSQQKSFNMQDAGYMGPGATKHVYEFRLYALSTAKFTPQSPNDQVKIRQELEADAAKIVLGRTNLRGISPD